MAQTPVRAASNDAQAFLWAFCATVAGLLTLALVNSLYWAVNGSRRIGMYIKECIEPRTNGGLQWETVFFHLSQKRYHWPSDSAAIGAAAVLANLVAATAASLVFLEGPSRLYPITAAAVLAVMSLPTIRRIVNAADSRREYSERIAQIVALIQRKKELADPSTSPLQSKAG